MWFGKRRGKRDEDEPRPPSPDELDDDFGFEADAPPKPAPGGGPGPRRGPAPRADRDDDTAVPDRPADRPLKGAAPASGPGRDLQDATIVERPRATPPDLEITPIPPALSAPDGGDADVTRFIGRPVAPTARTVAWLVAASGPDRGSDYRLDGRGTTVGTAPESALRLTADPYVSTHHAELRAEGGVWMLRDLGSTNGTCRNGDRVTETPLEDDDRVRFGLSDFVFKVARL